MDVRLGQKGFNARRDEMTISVGRDSNTSTRFEFCLFAGDRLVAREGGFKSTAAARRAGLKAAQAVS